MTKNKIKTIIMVVAIFLCLALAGGWIAQTVVTNKTANNQPETEEAKMDYSGNLILTEDEGNGISLMSAVVAMEDYKDYGISPQAETAYTLTATITPDDANNKLVDWAAKWKNGSSSWATGKTVTDYVTVTPESDGALTASVSCLQAFGEQIEISVTSRDNSNAKAICKVDYAQRLKSVSFSLGNFNILSNYSEGVNPTATAKMEIGKNITGTGGKVNVSYQGSDVYTVTDTFSVKVEMARYTYSSPTYYQPLGEDIKYGVELPIDVTQSSVYFDRSFMAQLGLYRYVSHGNEQLSEASVSTLASFYDAWSKACDWIIYFNVQLTGTYSSKSVWCHVKYGGYINSTPVSGVALDEASLTY